MKNVKRSIQIEEIKDDIFSDDIKTTALIEEIEAAEIAARQANIDKQIESSQPTKLQKLQSKASRKVAMAKKNLTEKVAELKEKKPADPRIEKTSLKRRLAIKVRAAKQPKMVVAIKMPKVKKAERKSFASQINALAPQGVSRKSVVELSIVAALIVTGAEIWAWNLSHPLFTADDREISVPVTGEIQEKEIDDDSPFTNTETDEDTARKDEAKEKPENNKSEDSTDTSTAGSRIYYSNNQGQGQSSTATPATTKNRTSNNTAKNYSNSTTIDGGWNDSYDSNWPTYEEPELPTPADDTPEQPNTNDASNEDAMTNTGETSEE